MAKLLNHLHVVFHTFLDALGADVVAETLEVVHLLGEVVLNESYSRLCLLLGCDKQVGGINLIFVEGSYALACYAVKFFDRVDFIVPPCYAQEVVAIGHPHVYGVALHPEVAAFNLYVVAQIQGIDKPSEKLVAVECLSALYADYTIGHGCRPAHTVDARNRRNHYNVLSARKQSCDSREAQLVDVLVYGEVLLDIRVGRWKIGLRLIIVVVGDVIFHGIIREEALHLLV